MENDNIVTRKVIISEADARNLQSGDPRQLYILDRSVLNTIPDIRHEGAQVPEHDEDFGYYFSPAFKSDTAQMQVNILCHIIHLYNIFKPNLTRMKRTCQM
jgi:hypothetical protein